jgi:N-acetylmuramoyl-L-alanine amidase
MPCHAQSTEPTTTIHSNVSRRIVLRHCAFAGGLFVMMIGAANNGLSAPGDPGSSADRKGDEIVAAGKYFHTGTRVVLWTDPEGYAASPSCYGQRTYTPPHGHDKKVRYVSNFRQLRRTVDQFVLHYDVDGTSRKCFQTLEKRGLSVQFMLDVDGTIYQTLDLKERAWQATISNNRSVGVEIANIGAYPGGDTNRLDQWYKREANGQTILTIPDAYGAAGVRTPGFVGHPARPDPVYGNIQGENLVQYDFTPQQYEALTKLTAALCEIFPKIKCDYPHDAAGKLIPHKLPDAQWKRYEGVLGHYHIQTDKEDPGPAFQWDRVIDGARKIMRSEILLSPRARGNLSSTGAW